MNWDIATSRFKKLFRFLEWRSQKEEILFWKNLLSTVVLPVKTEKPVTRDCYIVYDGFIRVTDWRFY